MHLTASDFYTYYSPHRCERRLFLRHVGTPEDPASPYQDVLHRLGKRHERAHLATFLQFVDLSGLSKNERLAATVHEVGKQTAIIYQPALSAEMTFNGNRCAVIGEPDFLIYSDSGCVIRDSKMSRRITEKDHPEILLQLGMYGWLYESTFGHAPAGLQVHSGTGAVVDVPYNETKSSTK